MTITLADTLHQFNISKRKSLAICATSTRTQKQGSNKKKENWEEVSQSDNFSSFLHLLLAVFGKVNTLSLIPFQNI